ncbi:YdiU family protein [Paenibacillus sp. J5C_2022]|uniref:protein adenylyltransferase SelO n=1 Tax=Paenibacillus sp. J5C2022 TaxID=2977129 RepID=UPI0021D370E6|nr:YdiU family protein [Paenibacillus sp. J5C2022]MCU6708247.1 YdiU family protein [Paenibacillus sp. J5C2022]
MEHQPNEAGWRFDNSYSRLPDMLFSEVRPTPVRSPGIVKLNAAYAEQLGLDAEALNSEHGAAVLAGNAIPEGALPIAQAYAGHQFGHFTMLGDGRAILLGEHIAPDGKRVDIQWKGSGRTPYSRSGDGRAALGPMLREYIISEAMHALGIPTTRSLAVVATGEPVFREAALPGAILVRTAASHIRVGTFQYVANWGDKEQLRLLADYAIGRHYPNCAADNERYLSMLREVIERQAQLIVKWQMAGFIHGVMNTDNMAISGETIDYGPCAFMDAYDEAAVFSSIDRQGRYAYRNQPGIAAWNLARLAETLLPLIHDKEDKAIELAEEALAQFGERYQSLWLAGMRAKLGLVQEEERDLSLANDWLALLQRHSADYTNAFLALTYNRKQTKALEEDDSYKQWLSAWHNRREQEENEAASQQVMTGSNPVVIPRNHRVEEALTAAMQGDYGVMDDLLDKLANPYELTPEKEAFCQTPDPSPIPYRTYCGT